MNSAVNGFDVSRIYSFDPEIFENVYFFNDSDPVEIGETLPIENR